VGYAKCFGSPGTLVVRSSVKDTIPAVFKGFLKILQGPPADSGKAGKWSSG